MCELLVCSVGQTNATSIYLDTKLPKAGDVIYAAEDGHSWGLDERTNANWRILALPGIASNSVSNLLTSEIQAAPVNPLAPSKTLQYRGFYLDLTNAAIPADMAAYLADATRAVGRFSVEATFALSSITLQRPVVADPAVVGSPPGVIG
jgi:hypothetical protein